MGRLINSSDLYNAIQIESDKCGIFKHEVEELFHDILINAPKVEDKPVGKWIPHIGMNHQCSICGAYFPLSEFKNRPFHVNYCIECGAKMENI